MPSIIISLNNFVNRLIEIKMEGGDAGACLFKRKDGANHQFRHNHPLSLSYAYKNILRQCFRGGKKNPKKQRV